MRTVQISIQQSKSFKKTLYSFSNYYYDYVVEKPGKTVLAYDTQTEKWWTVDGLQTPLALEGACAVKIGSRVALVGGKDVDGLIHKDVWTLELDNLESGWSNDQFPPMMHPRFHHGCSLVSLGGQTGIAVAGGRGDCRNTSSTAEFLVLSGGSEDTYEGKETSSGDQNRNPV